MATLYDQILEDIASITAELGNPVFTWNGTDYECVPSTANDSKQVDIGGFSSDSDLIVSVRSDLFFNSIYPEVQKSKITYLNKTYRVLKVGFLNHGAIIRLHCVSEFRFK